MRLALLSMLFLIATPPVSAMRVDVCDTSVGRFCDAEEPELRDLPDLPDAPGAPNPHPPGLPNLPSLPDVPTLDAPAAPDVSAVDPAAPCDRLPTTMFDPTPGLVPSLEDALRRWTHPRARCHELVG